MHSFIDDLDISRVIGAYLRLIPNGDGFKCVCPFHNDSGKSFLISPRKQCADCAVCGKTWDALEFVKDIENISEPDAVGVLRSSSWENVALTKREKIWPHLLSLEISHPLLYPPVYFYCRPLGGEPVRTIQFHKNSQLFAIRAAYSVEPGNLTWRWWTWLKSEHSSGRWDMRAWSGDNLPIFCPDTISTHPIGIAFTLEDALALADILPVYAPVGMVSDDWAAHDWSLLKGRSAALIWPPAGDKGIIAATQLASHLSNPSGAGLTVKIIEADDQPDGWGPSHALKEGWTSEDVREWAKPRLKEFLPENWVPPKSPKRPKKAPKTLAAIPESFSPEKIAQAWIECHGDTWRYVHGRDVWMEYADVKWRTCGYNAKGNPVRSVYAFITAIHSGTQALKLTDDEKLSMLSPPFLQAVVSVLSQSNALRLDNGSLNADRFALCTPDGVIDLRTGDIRAHDPKDLITLCTSVSPHSGESEAWSAYLATIPNPELLQRWAGYLLTGSVSERKFLFCQNDDIFLTVLSEIMGDYALRPKHTFFRDRHHNSDMSALRHKRIFYISEEYRFVGKDTPILSAIIGGDQVTSGFAWGWQESFVPQAKLCFSGEESPVRARSSILKRYQTILSFTPSVSPESRGDLLDALRSEYPQILKWALDGARLWLDGSLYHHGHIKIY